MSSGVPDIIKAAKILADQSRVDILTVLMDGRFHTVNEISKYAKVKPNTTSYHLAKFLELDWVESNKTGRFKYYRLKKKEIATIIESFMSISPGKEIKSFNQNSEMKKLKQSRTCYDHIAGELGVQIFSFLIEKKYILDGNSELTLTLEGESFFNDLGVDINSLKCKKRNFCTSCIDWSERQYHLSGSLGNALYLLFLEKEWICQNPNSRSLTITSEGQKNLNIIFCMAKE
ncbi:winged helix-turn-helix domain-containing protein [Clostridium malenominatum]|uniref:Winged helix-turn-helix domain-containing protein n=1 Tax=Clostridium malenominatum TaxID=1539 RepID=A0ABN1IKR5_9CLOT